MKLKSNDKRHFDTQCKKSLRKEGGWVKDGSLKAKTGGQKAQLMTSKDTKNKVSPYASSPVLISVEGPEFLSQCISSMVSSLELFLALNRFLVNNSIDEAVLSIFSI